MSEQSDRLNSLLDRLTSITDGIDTEIKTLSQRAAVPGAVTDTEINAGLDRLAGLVNRLGADLPAVTDTASAVAAGGSPLVDPGPTSGTTAAA